jgi:hypothetical protein
MWRQNVIELKTCRLGLKEVNMRLRAPNAYKEQWKSGSKQLERLLDVKNKTGGGIDLFLAIVTPTGVD